ncbi:MAG: hypothetical protein U1C71_02785, partial [archaeon]|nr:hypothetical protein [archaeon]
MGTRGSSGRRRPAAENVANKPGRGRKAWDTTKEVATRSALIAAALSAAYWGGRIAGYPLNKKTYEQNIDRAVRYAETMDEAGPKRPAVLYRIMSPELTRLLNVERGFIRSPDQRAAKRLYSLLPQKSKTLYRDILEFELERQFNRMISDLER